MKIELKEVSFKYKKSNFIINNFSQTFESNKLYLIQGKNGSGKTTLSKIICGLLRPQKGCVFIDGEDIKKKRTAEIAKDLGYLFQNPDMQLFATTVWEELAFIYDLNKNLTAQTKEKINHILKQFRLEKLKDSFPLILSGGEKQRLALATIFIRDVKFLVLDEPLASIDSEGRAFLTSLIKDFLKKGGGVILISHERLPLDIEKETVLLGEEYEF